ncbi:hypothetical protein KEM55_003855 [Ascosphaera atra]|nr:hypothetical protein KEM55_003855 [Ascosphaera atra]
MAGNGNEYAKKTNAELIEILRTRGLPTSGKKADLVARLQESDKPAANTEAPAATAAPAAPAATEKAAGTQDDVIDWDDELAPEPSATTQPANADTDTTATTVTPATTQPEASTAATTATTTTTATTPAANGQEAATKEEQTAASTETQQQGEQQATEEAMPQENFALGLAASDLEAELAKRRARAEKFGIVEDSKEAIAEAEKKLERAKRFAAAGGDAPAPESGEAAGSKIVKGLDQALGEERPRKRGRGANGDAGGRGKRFRGRGGRPGGRGRGPRQERPETSNTSAAPSAGLSEADKAAMERRKARFG